MVFLLCTAEIEDLFLKCWDGHGILVLYSRERSPVSQMLGWSWYSCFVQQRVKTCISNAGMAMIFLLYTVESEDLFLQCWNGHDILH